MKNAQLQQGTLTSIPDIFAVVSIRMKELDLLYMSLSMKYTCIFLFNFFILMLTYVGLFRILFAFEPLWISESLANFGCRISPAFHTKMHIKTLIKIELMNECHKQAAAKYNGGRQQWCSPDDVTTNLTSNVAYELNDADDFQRKSRPSIRHLDGCTDDTDLNDINITHLKPPPILFQTE